MSNIYFYISYLILFGIIKRSFSTGDLFNAFSSFGSNVLKENRVISPALNYIINPVQSFQSSNLNNNPPTNIDNPDHNSKPFAKPEQQFCSGETLIGVTTTATCSRNGQKIPCVNLHLPGDEATIRCKTGYTTNHHLIKNDLQCLSSGRWSSPIHECVANCGRITKKAQPLIVNGVEAQVSDFPWNVAVYKNEILICGGSIINERVILSAAHCFVTETLTGTEKVNENLFEIVAGKYRRDYHAIEASLQHFKPSKITIHHAYQGYSGNYDADIAIVTLDRRIEYKAHVAPVCLDFDLKTIRDKQPPSEGTMGMVAGYGFTEVDEKPSETLKKIDLPIVDFIKCRDEAPDNFKSFLTSDKFCAGHTDGKSGVCKGDSGAGLVVPKLINGENIYFLHGIVSNSRSVNGGCDLNFYALFTHVQNYIDIVREEIRLAKSF